MTDCASRLRDAVKNAGGNATLAAKAGVPLSSLDTYIAGREMRLSKAVTIAAACGVRLEWLATGEGPMKVDELVASEPQGPVEPDDRALRHVAWDVLTQVSAGGQLSRSTAELLANILARQPGQPPAMQFGTLPAHGSAPHGYSLSQSRAQANASLDRIMQLLRGRPDQGTVS